MIHNLIAIIMIFPEGKKRIECSLDNNLDQDMNSLRRMIPPNDHWRTILYVCISQLGFKLTIVYKLIYVKS